MRQLGKLIGRDRLQGLGAMPPGLPSYDALTYKAFLIPPTAYDNLLYNGPCVLDALITTVVGTGAYTWKIFDGITPAGTPLFIGGIQPMQLCALKITVQSGVYFQAVAGATNASWTITIGTP